MSDDDILVTIRGLNDRYADAFATADTDALLALFEAEWERAVPMVTDADQSREHLGVHVDDLDARIISLLLAGYADHAVASQTETSMRTVQRRVQLLMQRTGAETRMQLGYRAARLGWI